MKTIKTYIFILLSATFVLICGNSMMGAVKGDTVRVNEKSLYHFESIRENQSWLESNNPAGLGFYNFRNISYVEGFYQKNNGGFVKYYESNNSFKFGIQTESFMKLKKISMYGKLGYNNFQGNNMTWSGLIYPEEHLVNVADEVPSDKRQENYFIAGMVAAPIYKNLTGGFSLNYESSNLAKMQDLRHSTDYMNLDVKGGLIYTLPYVNVGINYLYRKYYERVYYQQISDDSHTFYAHYLKGLWFGLSGAWDTKTLHLDAKLPLTEIINGVAFQAELKLGHFSFLNEFTYKYQKGKSGVGSDKTYNNSFGNIYEYYGKMHLDNGRINQYLTVETQYREDVNKDNIFTSQMVNGETIVVQYGEAKVYDRRIFNWNAEYNFTWGEKYNPSWDVKVGYEHYAKSSVSSLVLPYYYSQNMNYNLGYVNARKNFVFGTGMLDLSLGVDYSNGFGTKLEEHKIENVQTDIAEDKKPKPVETLLNKEYEYYTTPKIGGEVGARYSYFINRKKGRGGNVYLDAKYRLLSASDAVYAGDTKAHMFRIALGVNF